MGPVQILEFNHPNDLRAIMQGIGADPGGIATMVPKGIFRLIKITGLSCKAANLLKQEMLSKGGDCAVNRGVCVFEVETSDVLLMGTLRQYRELCQKLRLQPFGLKEVSQEITLALNKYDQRSVYSLQCRDKTLDIGSRTLIMGILNVTPDSFSDGGSYANVEAAVKRALEMVEEGADIIDVGAESTRPNGASISAEEEMERLLPVLKELVPRCPVPVSVDTYKAKTARAALELGVHMVNDVWGFQADEDMAETCAEFDVPVVLMHNRQTTDYQDLMGEINSFLAHGSALAMKAGIKAESVILDPGIGFGKTYQQNLEVMQRLGELKALGHAILLGTSRKSIIGNTLGLPVNERVEGTAATVALGIAKGADIVRVHDIREMKRVVKMTDAMVRRGYQI